ncbi:hypothetical protein GCM10015536_20000 [Streptomyces griseomycini]|nr:hypothetical protein GCM10015536_20000 [Streptomyces griseomycini]
MAEAALVRHLLPVPADPFPYGVPVVLEELRQPGGTVVQDRGRDGARTEVRAHHRHERSGPRSVTPRAAPCREGPVTGVGWSRGGPAPIAGSRGNQVTKRFTGTLFKV